MLSYFDIKSHEAQYLHDVNDVVLPNSVLSRLSRNTFPPIFWTTISHEYADRVQHIKVAKIVSVANTFTSF